MYENHGDGQRAVAAMYMLPFGSTFAQVPDVGGSLTQWHVHRDLCLTNNPQQKIVAGLTSVDGTCPPGTSKAGNTPMLHVWIITEPVRAVRRARRHRRRTGTQRVRPASVLHAETPGAVAHATS